MFKDGNYYLVDIDIGDPKGAHDAAIKEFEGLRDRVCACRDKACAEAVGKDFDAFVKENANARSIDDETQNRLSKSRSLTSSA